MAVVRGLRARWQASTRFQDVVTAVVTFAIGLTLNLIGLTDVIGGLDFGNPPEWWHSVLLAVGCVAMLVKRRRPVVALGVGGLMFTADVVTGGSIAMVLVIFDLLFSVGQFASARARTTVMTVVFVTVGTLSVVVGLASADLRVTAFLGAQLTGILVVPLWWAANLRQQRQLNELTVRQARRDAVHAERSAMARELHDVIAGHLSTTAIHSAAALALPPDSDRDRQALREVRASSLAALDEMRTMIMLLRADAQAGETVVPDGLAHLAQQADPDVRLDVPDGLRLPALVDHAAYRIVREALTNARKHAPGGLVRVQVRPFGDHVRVTVTNPVARPSSVRRGPLSARTGLISMTERANLLGGRVIAGPDGDVWRVDATLPLGEAPPSPDGPGL